MFLIFINFIPRTESQAFRTHSFSLFYSLLPPLFWKISPLHSWFFFFNLCSSLEFCHTEMCLKYFNVILKRKILIGRMTVLAVVSYCELTDVNSYSWHLTEADCIERMGSWVKEGKDLHFGRRWNLKRQMAHEKFQAVLAMEYYDHDV